MAKDKPFNLFVYGTLTNPSVFRAVLGRSLVPRKRDADGVTSFRPKVALLQGYKKISPDNTYLYAVPDRHGRIRGYLVGPLPGECLSSLRNYEGRNYSRKRVKVHTRDGAEEAVVFVGNREQLEHSFGYEFRDHLKQEFLLSEKIEAALGETQREQLHTGESIGRRTVGELRGPTIRDLVRKHFEAGGISDYAIRHSLKEGPLRDFAQIVQEPGAKALAPNYLAMVVRQVIFNQFEDRIRRDFRYELDHLPHVGEYYDRSISSLVALQVLNASSKLLYLIVADCLADLSFETDHLVDFIQSAIIAADAIYDEKLARQHLRFVLGHMGSGHIALGAELEFSDIGHEVIRDPKGETVCDVRYDGFLYFADFGLDVLTWRLGGHVDDHHEKASTRRRRGFFEVALGSLSIEANLSKPISRDPWLLNRFIQEARRFFPVRPHSVHISLQMPSQHRRTRDRVLPVSVMKCLFALAGDPRPDSEGRVRIPRLVSDEIVNRTHPSLLFSEIRKRYSRDVEEPYVAVRGHGDEGKYVQQFRFLRLSADVNYEPIVMALKGVQLRLRPGSFMTFEQYKSSRKHRRAYESLLEWGGEPTALSDEEIESFLGPAYEGLMTERRGKPAHSEAYIAWAIHQLRERLREFNELVSGADATEKVAAGGLS